MSEVIDNITKNMQTKIQEWIKADEEGRLVILPFAPGTVLYQIMPKCGGGRVCPYNEGPGTDRCGKDIHYAKCGPYVKAVTYQKPIDIDVSKYYTDEEKAQQVLKQIEDAQSLIERAKALGYV